MATKKRLLSLVNSVIMKLTLMLFLFLFGALYLRAADENLFHGIQGTGITNAASDATEIVVADTWYDQYSSFTDDDYFTVERTQAKVKLWFDDALKKYYSSGWTLTIEYDIELKETDGATITTTTLPNEQLTINYHPTSPYQDIDLKIFDADTYIKVKVYNISIVTNTLPSGIIADDFHLDVELNTRRYYILETNETCSVGYNTTYIDPSSTNELELYWSYVEGAESYDVEWLFIDEPTATLSSLNVTYNFREATRVNCLTNNYKISMAYPRGLFLFRVRPVGKEVVGGEVKRIEGSWSLAATGTTGGVSSAVKYAWSGLLTGMNWQYQASFAEEGKRGEMLGIYDGSLKPRQQVAINNSENTAVISQPIYDYLGRPSLMLLPTPTTNYGLGFYEDRTLDGSVYYDYTNFDEDGNIETPDDMDGLGVETYYSNGGATGTHAAYVADAEGYPYMRTAYLNDGTGRVKWQTAAGGTGIGASDIDDPNTHIIKYMYGTPTQEELYRLFGNEVGNASHYKKNVVIDQNGQAHIQYLDMSGRVIGTALAGDAPINMLEIDSYPASFDELTANLGINNYINDDGNLALNKTIAVPYTTEFEFTYSLADIGFSPECISGTINPEYDVVIYIEDENHNIIEADFENDGLPYETGFTFTGVTSVTTLNWTITLQPGTYTINKIITLNQAHINTLYANYLENQTCFSYSLTEGTPCNPSCEDLCFSGYGFIDDQGNTYYQAEDGSFVAMIDTEEPATTTYFNGNDEEDLADILALIEACENQCADGVQIPEVDECEIKYEQMLADVSPGGQYFDNVPFASGVAPNNTWLIAETGETDPGDVFTTTYDTWDEVRNNWDPNWATSLVEYHPEYCIYSIKCNRITGDYDGGGSLTSPDCGTAGFTGMTEQEYTQLMNSITYNIVDTSPEEYLFNPLNTTFDDDHAVAGDYEIYQPYDDGLTDDELDPYIGCRPHLLAELETRLQQFLDADGAGEFHSIWYVLDDPDDIHLGGSGYPAITEDFYIALHGDGVNPGLIGTGTDQVTKYQFFRGVYLFLRDYVDYQSLYDFSSITVPDGCSVSYLEDEPLVDGMTDDGFVIRFPANPAFENYESGSLDTWIGGEVDNQCQAQCEQNAVNWIAELGDCVDPGDVAIMEDYLIAICEAGCDEDNPQGTDDIDPAVTADFGWGTFSSFEEVIDYYNTTYSEDCPIVKHPEPTFDETQDDCECTIITDFVTQFYLQNSIALPAQFDDIAGDLDTGEEASLLSDLEEYATGSDLTDLQAWLDDCIEDITPTGVPEAFTCVDPPTEFDLEGFDEDCGEAYDDLQSYYDMLAFNGQVQDGWTAFLGEYTELAFSNLPTREVFTMVYELQEYHYTLFYYDQAGNLIKTVPPAGIYREANGAENAHSSTLDAAAIQTCFDHVADPVGEPYIHPAHVMVTNYRYNSLQQLIQQTTPDGGETNFYYDELGRLAVSQNAQQVIDAAYSYTVYDVLGRIIEVGEITDVETPITSDITRNASDYYDWLTLNTGDGFTDRSEVVRTVYDDYANSATIISELDNVEPHSVRNRIGSVIYQEVYDASVNNYDYAMHYSYDVNGNVKTVLDENPNHPIAGQEYKRMDYEYDLASGNVNQVNYQPGEADEFYYRYEYDANNRLTVAYTSVNGEIWEKESKNFYYAHGPLARLELGDKTVQAQDYVYTVNGWLKTVNSSVHNSEWDAGRDGKTSTQHEYVARDAYGFSLHYYTGDYVASNTTTAANLLIDLSACANYDTDSPDLFNGNISKMVVSLSNTSEVNQTVFANAYQYDQLNRIKSFKVHKASGADVVRNNNEVTNANSANNGDYQESYTFDGNGNLLTLNRNIDGGGTTIDAFAYHYKTDLSGNILNNQLRHVDDPTSSGASTVDVDDQSADNYTYNEIGQLISDAQEDITLIEWTVTGKVKKITYGNGDYIEFHYDPFGNRVSKLHFDDASGDITQTLYVHDASGNVMAVYEYTDDGVTETFELAESHIYGGKRLGLSNRAVDLITPPSPDTETRTLGNKMYELSNHLGNVLEVISDRTLTIDGNTDNFTDYYMADVRSYCDYTPYGVQMEGRSGSTPDYRYSFQGQESDDEIKGNGNSINYKYRMHDPRIGRFFAVDPLTPKYPELTPYQFSSNCLIAMVELEGLEGAWKVSGYAWNSHGVDDVADFNKFSETQLAVYYAKNVQGDCADLAVRLLIDYAQKNGLVVTLHDTEGKPFSSDEARFNRGNDDVAGKQAFYEYAANHTTAASIAKYDTFLVSEEEQISGDMKFVIPDDYGDPAHTMIVFMNAKYLTAGKNLRDMVIYDNPEPTPITVSVDPYNQGSRGNDEAVSRWNLLDDGEVIHLDPADDWAPEEEEIILIPEDE